MKKLSDCKEYLEGTVIITPFLANLCAFVNFCVKFSKKEELKGLYLENLSFNDQSNHLKVIPDMFLPFCFCYIVLTESSLEARKKIISLQKLFLLLRDSNFRIFEF